MYLLIKKSSIFVNNVIIKIMEIKDAIKTLTTELLNDPSYKTGWQSNIAMAFKDRAYEYKKQTKRKYLTQVDIHIIANDAANNFLNLLTKKDESGNL